MNKLPSLLDDAHVDIRIGWVVRGLVDPYVKDGFLDEKHRIAAEVVVASFFLPMLAREDRVASYLGRDHALVRQIGWRLRRADIWQGEKLAEDCYEDLFDEEPLAAGLAMMLLAHVGMGTMHAARDKDGVMAFSLKRQPYAMHIEGRRCEKCATTKKYGQTGACVECTRRYAKAYREPVLRPSQVPSVDGLRCFPA